MRRAALEGGPDATANDVMEAGPSTIRADTPLDPLRDRLERRELTTAIVTTPEGVLLGVVRRADLEVGSAGYGLSRQPRATRTTATAYSTTAAAAATPSATATDASLMPVQPSRVASTR